MTTTEDRLRVAVYQCEPRPLAVEENLDRLAGVIRDAGRGEADVLVTPEMFLTGYAIGAAAVDSLAQPADGPWAKTVAGLARASGTAVLYGYPERVGDVAYNSVQLVGADGRRLANYRKTHLFGAVDRAQFRPADDASAVVEIAGWRCGMLICYDVEFPETTRSLALAGVDVVLAPTANMKPYDVVATTLVPARAYENQVYFAYANYCGEEGEWEYCGLSCIASPEGTDVARADRGEELLIGELDRKRLEASRRSASYLVDRRPELYHTLVDPRPAHDRSRP